MTIRDYIIQSWPSLTTDLLVFTVVSIIGAFYCLFQLAKSLDRQRDLLHEIDVKHCDHAKVISKIITRNAENVNKHLGAFEELENRVKLLQKLVLRQGKSIRNIRDIDKIIEVVNKK